MKSTRILVTGAAGKTGAAAVQQLLQRGFTVRALVRTRDERAARIEALRAESVEGDLHDLESARVVKASKPSPTARTSWRPAPSRR